MATGSKECWQNRRQAIAAELSGLLNSGYVLTRKEVGAVAARHGYSPKSPITPHHFGRTEAIGEDYQIYIGPTRVTEQRIKSTVIVRHADLPIEETDFEEVKARIEEQVRRSRLRLPQ